MSERTIATLRAVRRLGVEIVFVTGRPVRWMPPVALATGLDGLAICANGAVLYDLQGDAVVSAAAMAHDVVLAVVDALRQAMPKAVFAVETLEGLQREPAYAPRFDTPGGGAQGDIAVLLEQNPHVIKVLCRVPGGRASSLLEQARSALGDLADPVHSNPDDCLLEIGPPGVSKGAALAKLAAGLGIAQADVMAFGDMPNDVPMLSWAGIGYAMADSDPEALAAADRVAPACADDGVAVVLEQIFSL
jgi:hypothetical protein